MPKNFLNLPKTYFFDNQSKNIVLAFLAKEETPVELNGETYFIPKNHYAYLNDDKQLIILPKNKFEKRFSIISEKFGLVELFDLNNTVLNLKVLKEEIIFISTPEINEMEISTKSRGIIKFIFKDEAQLKQSFSFLKNMLSLLNKTT